MREVKIKSIYAYCKTCCQVLAETHETDPFLKPIARRVIYESANRHKEISEHSVMVVDPQEYARRTIPN